MAFATTNNAPSTNPKVSLMFSGLMVLKPGAAANTCEVGLHKLDRGHNLQVILVVNKANRPPILSHLVTGPLTSNFEISPLANPLPPPDFKVFERDPFDRTTQNSHELDHRWAINLGLKHPGVEINDGALPAVTLNTGVLYTPNLTNPLLDPTLARVNTPDDKLNQIAPNLAVSIDLSPGQRIIFKGRDQGAPLELILPRLEDVRGDETYTLAFINEPPGRNSPPHDEFSLYYRILEVGGAEIPAEERFKLKFEQKSVRSDEIPCMPTTRNP